MTESDPDERAGFLFTTNADQDVPPLSEELWQAVYQYLQLNLISPVASAPHDLGRGIFYFGLHGSALPTPPWLTKPLSVALEQSAARRESTPLARYLRQDMKGGVLVMTKTVDGNTKIDWPSFSQEVEKKLSRFLLDPSAPSTQTFRVFLQRSAYNPDQNESFAFHLVTSLGYPLDGLRFKTKANGELAALLKAGFGKNLQSKKAATVELTRTADGKSILLTRFLCWEFLGLTDNPLLDLKISDTLAPLLED